MTLNHILSRLQHFQRLVFQPAEELQDERARRSLRMVISLMTFHLVLIVITAFRLQAANAFALPAVIQILLHIVILTLIYTRYTRIALSLFLMSYIASNFLGIAFYSLTNMLYVVTAFVAVTVLLENRYRLLHGIVVIAAVLITGYLTMDDPRYASVSHDNVVLFAALGIISVMISTSVVAGDMRVSRAQVEAVNAQREELERFFTSALDLLCIADLSGYFKRVNMEWQVVLGYTPAELEGKSFLEFVHPDDLPATLDALKQLSARSPVMNFTNRYRCKDGSYRLIEWRSYPYGQLIYAAARDITESHETRMRLKESEALLAEAERIAQLGSWRWDVASDRITWSQELINIFGAEQGALPGDYTTYLTLIHPLDREMVESNIRSAVDSGQSYRFYHRILHPLHGERIIDARGNIARDDDGRLLYLYGTAQDVTEVKQIEIALTQSQQLWDALLNALPDLVIHFNVEGKILEVKGNTSNVPIPVSAYLGKDISQIRTLVAQYDVSINPAVFDRIAEKLRSVIETGELQTVEYNLSSSQAGKQYSELRLVTTAGDHILGIIRNTTHEVENRHEQQRLTDELQAANQKLQDFAYVVSHDLKTPLRGISTITGWLEQDYRDHLGSEGREMLTLLKHRALRMETMIEGVLEYSRIGREERIQDVDINSLLRDIAQEVVSTTNCTIALRGSFPRIPANPIRIRQIFQNLIDNAVKYMDKPTGMIEITCQRDEAWWLFSVADNGPGIEGKHFERIFQLFQVLNPRDDVDSTGIGLTIVKRILESYGGKIWLRSIPGEGTTFFFTLPALTGNPA
jgi:PAS domain S-box-containing protein